MSGIIDRLKERKVTEEARKAVYEVLIPAFQRQDWDTEAECLGADPVYDVTLRALCPGAFDDDESANGD